jgi:hypothetical protein
VKEDPMTGNIQIRAETDPSIINASPTKELFINMLVKDISLLRSIIDLVDNSLDGAKRIRGEGPYTGLWVKIEISEDSFKITDNCGGISVQLARDYAFRFGRPEDMEATTRSIGQFGVGMKRALFKIGNIFSVESTAKESSFFMKVNVNEWKLDKATWQFKFIRYQENQHNRDENLGTEIIVEEIHKEDIRSEFKQDKFIRQLANQLQEAYTESLARGLVITVNRLPLRVEPLKLLSSISILPAYRNDRYVVGAEKEEVFVKIYAGISDSNPEDAGWYIFCNGRLVLGANQTSTTGWGEGDEVTIPKYHNQYARFRGYVFFDADNASLLPWNTTKTGVDSDSFLYKAVRQNMLTIMRSVITFLNQLKDEKDTTQERDDGPIEYAIAAAELAKLTDINTTGLPKTFKPKISILYPPKKANYGNITYSKPIDEIGKIKKALGVRSNKEVGEKTFEYFLGAEVLEDE